MTLPPDVFEARVQAIVDETLLSEREAQVFLLRRVDECSPGEISNILDLANSTVSEYINRLRHKRHEATETKELAQNTIELFESGGYSGGQL